MTTTVDIRLYEAAGAVWAVRVLGITPSLLSTTKLPPVGQLKVVVVFQFELILSTLLTITTTHVLRCCRGNVGGVGAAIKEHVFASDCSTKYDVDSRVHGVT